MSDFVQYDKQHGGRCPYPAVSVNFKHGRITIMTEAYKAMGEPTFVNIYGDGDGSIAFEPTNANERESAWTCQKQTSNGAPFAQVSFGQITTMKDTDETKRFEIEQDDNTGYWVFNIND